MFHVLNIHFKNEKKNFNISFNKNILKAFFKSVSFELKQ